MSIDYSLYYRGAPADLAAALDHLSGDEGMRALFPSVHIRGVTRFGRQILAEEGFPDDFDACALLRLNKWRLAEAQDALRGLRAALGPARTLILFQNETELPA